MPGNRLLLFLNFLQRYDPVRSEKTSIRFMLYVCDKKRIALLSNHFVIGVFLGCSYLFDTDPMAQPFGAKRIAATLALAQFVDCFWKFLLGPPDVEYFFANLLVYLWIGERLVPFRNDLIDEQNMPSNGRTNDGRNKRRF